MGQASPCFSQYVQLGVVFSRVPAAGSCQPPLPPTRAAWPAVVPAQAEGPYRPVATTAPFFFCDSFVAAL